MKPLTSYSMNFKTRWSTSAAAFLALFFFLRVIHYTVLEDITKISPGTIVFRLVLPLLLGIIGLLLLRVLRLRHPLFYAILSAAMCLLVLIWNCGNGDVLRIILSVIWYPVCAGALVMTALGFIPWRLPVSLALALALILRVTVYDLGAFSGLGWVPEGSVICLLAALFCISRCFEEITTT